MKSVVLVEPSVLRADELPEAAQPGPREALVRIHRIGVCGTDLHAFRGKQPFFSYPRILGHELGVEVLALGPGDTPIQVGDRCAVEPYLNCGHCIACRRGKPNCCTQLKVLGVHVDGGMRERLIVPTAKLHPSLFLTYDQLALVEPLGIGAHAVERAQLERGETVAVIGTGPIGLSVIQFALAAQVRVLAIDVNQKRLAFCRDRLGLPANDTIDLSANADLPAQLNALTNGDLPTAVFDATGNPASMASTFNHVAHGGRIVFVGLFTGDVTFNDPNFHRRELTLLASRNARPKDFQHILSLVETGKVDTSPWITHRAELADIPEKFSSWTLPETGVLKAMISV